MTKKMFKVLCPVEGKGTKKDRTFWKDCGRGFENHNQSLTLHLDVLPVNGKLCIFEMTEDDLRRRDAARANDPPPPPPIDPAPLAHDDHVPF
jgi:hypothetical protein